MIKGLLVTSGTAGLIVLGALSGNANAAAHHPAAPAPAHKPAASAPGHTCHAHKMKGQTTWTCVSPNSACRPHAHNQFGYVSKGGQKLQCTQSNGKWIWTTAPAQ